MIGHPDAWWRFSLLLVIVVLGSVACEPRVPDAGRPEERGALDAYQQGRTLVEQSLAALGGIEALEEAGPLMLVGEGTTDLNVRLQGMHSERPYPVAAQETLAVDWAGDRVAYETHAKVNPDADEWIRYVYDEAGRQLIVLRLSEQAFWAGVNPDHKERYRRMLPHVLLHEALAQRQTLHYAGRVHGEEAVRFTLPTGEVAMLLLDPKRHFVRGVEYVLSLPVHGDTAIRWRFGEYRMVEGLGPYPTGYRIEVGGRPLKEMQYTHIEIGHDLDRLFGAPDGVTVPGSPPVPSDGPASPSKDALAEAPLPPVRTVAEGVHLAVNVRGGFHHLLVEFEDFVLVVDAPAGYHELQMIPAIDWAGEVTPSTVGQRLLDAIHAEIPGKPVRYVVLTHHHADHAGGIRPFIDVGATILTTSATKSVVEAAAANAFTLQPDRLTGRRAQPTLDIVNGERIISDGQRSVRLIDVGENPHAEGMLVVYLPGERILYQSDLFVPSSGSFPDPARLPVMRWFVNWLDRSGLEVDALYAVHGSARISAEHLAQVRALGSE